MNEAYRAKMRRSAELGSLTSAALGDMLTAAGWKLTGRDRKQDRVQAILHLEKHEVQEAILKPLGMERLEPVVV